MPLLNIHQTLVNAERLSYRQLCIVSVHEPHSPETNPHNLAPLPYHAERSKQFHESVAGVYEDVYYLMAQGFVG
jgi:hypothetical protein